MCVVQILRWPYQQGNRWGLAEQKCIYMMREPGGGWSTCKAQQHVRIVEETSDAHLGKVSPTAVISTFPPDPAHSGQDMQECISSPADPFSATSRSNANLEAAMSEHELRLHGYTDCDLSFLVSSIAPTDSSQNCCS